jgi:hypothetical protein
LAVPETVAHRENTKEEEETVFVIEQEETVFVIEQEETAHVEREEEEVLAVDDDMDELTPNKLSMTMTPLPPGWVEMVVDNDAGEVSYYYLYEPDGTTQWERPVLPSEGGGVPPQQLMPPTVVDEIADQEAEMQQVEDEPEYVYVDRPDGSDEPIEIGHEEPWATQGSAKAEEPLPQGWKELLDADSGVPYYVYEPPGIDRPPPAQLLTTRRTRRFKTMQPRHPTFLRVVKSRGRPPFHQQISCWISRHRCWKKMTKSSGPTRKLSLSKIPLCFLQGCYCSWRKWRWCFG